jgi:hypothetical protein
MIVPAARRRPFPAGNPREAAGHKFTNCRGASGLRRLTCFNCSLFLEAGRGHLGNSPAAAMGTGSGRWAPGGAAGARIRQNIDMGRIFIAKGRDLC